MFDQTKITRKLSEVKFFPWAVLYMILFFAISFSYGDSKIFLRMFQ